MKKHRHRTLQFRRHFRIYLKNNHPAYIVDEEGNLYVFHRVTHSETSGGKKNIPKANPLVRDTSRIMYIVKKEQRDKKNKFSLFELDVKKGFDISYPDIKKSDVIPTLETTRHKAGLDTNPVTILNQ